MELGRQGFDLTSVSGGRRRRRRRRVVVPRLKRVLVALGSEIQEDGVS